VGSQTLLAEVMGSTQRSNGLVHRILANRAEHVLGHSGGHHRTLVGLSTAQGITFFACVKVRGEQKECLDYRLGMGFGPLHVGCGGKIYFVFPCISPIHDTSHTFVV